MRLPSAQEVSASGAGHTRALRGEGRGGGTRGQCQEGRFRIEAALILHMSAVVGQHQLCRGEPLVGEGMRSNLGCWASVCSG